MTVICTGLSPLLNLCASGVVRKSDCIQFLAYRNVYDLQRFRSSTDCTFKFASEIANFFGYEIKLVGPYDWICPPRDKRKSNEEISFELPELAIDGEVIVTSNAMLFVEGLLGGKDVSLFPEGASCFAGFKSNNKFIRALWEGWSRPVLKNVKLRFATNPYKISKRWLLSDFDGRIRTQTNNMPSFDVLDAKALTINYRRCADYFANKYPEIDYRMHTEPFFHPLVENLGAEGYARWLDGWSDLIGERTLIVKTRPRDIRDDPIFFNNFNIIFPPIKYRELPGELFLFQTDMKYVGYFSSMILPLEAKNVFFTAPPDAQTVEEFTDTYAGLKRLLCL